MASRNGSEWPEEATAESRPEADGFDVTVETVIGRVTFGMNGHHNALEAAYLLIAQHDEPGLYRFPAERGGTITVTVDYPENPDR